MWREEKKWICGWFSKGKLQLISFSYSLSVFYFYFDYNLFQIPIDSEGNEINFDVKEMYGEHHVTSRLKEAYPAVDYNSMFLIDSPDGNLEVRGVMSSGCIATLDITVLGT